MNKLHIKITFFLLVLLSLSSCCFFSALTPHSNFIDHIQGQIGKSETDPNSSLTRYPKRIKGKSTLPNGNIETEFSFSRNCKVFYEVNISTRIIENVRYEGNGKRCVLVP